MTNTFRVTWLQTLLSFALVLVAGCQNQAPDLGSSADQSATSSNDQLADQPSSGALEQITLNVTGMS